MIAIEIKDFNAGRANCTRTSKLATSRAVRIGFSLGCKENLKAS